MVEYLLSKRPAVIGVTVVLSLAQAAQPAPAAPWRVVKDTTYPMDDSRWLEIELDADQKLNGWLTSSVPKLKVSCREAAPRVELRAGISLEISSHEPDAHRLRFRFDSEEAISEDWTFSRDAAGLVSPSPTRFIIGLKEHRLLLVEVLPLEAEKEVVHFTLPNLVELFPQLRQACGWQIEPPRRKRSRGQEPVNPTKGQRRITGQIEAYVTVDEKGNVVSVSTSEGHEVLRKAVEEAAWTWKFEPATLGGVPVTAEVTVPVAFTR